MLDGQKTTNGENQNHDPGGYTSTIVLGLCWPIQLPPPAKAVLISLADQANDAGVCWPSVGTITKRTCLSERTCQGALAKLEELGHVTKEERAGRSTIFHIHPDGQNLSTDPRRSRTPRGAGAAPGGAGPAPRTVTEPSLNPKAGRGTRLPPAWKPTPDLQAWARQGRPWLDVPAVVATFVDHWTAVPGGRGVKLDWAATWRNWVRKERPPAAFRTTGPAPAAVPCGNCGAPLTGNWTQSPKGRVCARCHDGYMGAGWPKPELELRP